MKKMLFVPSVLAVIGAGCVGASAPATTVEQPTAPVVAQSPQPATANSLNVVVKTRIEKDEPVGHDVAFSGVVNQTTFFPINAKGVGDTPIVGTEVGRQGFYWAGAQYDLVFLNKGGGLQILQEVKGEEGGDPERRVLMTLTVPAASQITVK